LRVVGGDLAGGAGSVGEVGVVGAAEEWHERPGLVVVERRADLGRHVAVGHVGDQLVELGDELEVDLLAPAQGLRRHRRVGAGEDVVQRGVALPLRLDHPLVHGHAGVPYHAEHMAKFRGCSMLC